MKSFYPCFYMIETDFFFLIVCAHNQITPLSASASVKRSSVSSEEEPQNKIHVNEERMAARMQELHLDNNNLDWHPDLEHQQQQQQQRQQQRNAEAWYSRSRLVVAKKDQQ